MYKKDNCIAYWRYGRLFEEYKNEMPKYNTAVPKLGMGRSADSIDSMVTSFNKFKSSKYFT